MNWNLISLNSVQSDSLLHSHLTVHAKQTRRVECENHQEMLQVSVLSSTFQLSICILDDKITATMFGGRLSE